MTVARRRFPIPWSVEVIGAAFVVKDSAPGRSSNKPGAPVRLLLFLVTYIIDANLGS